MSWRPVSLPKYLISVVLSFALIALSPGFAAYEAAAATVTSAAGVKAQTGVAPITSLNNISIGAGLNTGLAPAQSLRLSGTLSVGIAPTVRTSVRSGPAELPIPPAPAVKVGVAAAPVSPVSQIPMALGPSSLKAQAVLLSPERTAPTAAAPTAQKLNGMSQQVADTLKAAGSLSQAGAEAASGVGSRIETILTGAPAASYNDGDFVGAAQMMGDL